MVWCGIYISGWLELKQGGKLGLSSFQRKYVHLLALFKNIHIHTNTGNFLKHFAQIFCVG